MAKRTEPNERLDRYLSAFSLALRVFTDDRDWDQYHTPRNLAIAVFSEAGELAGEFRWTEDPDITRVRDELADVFIFTCMLADRMNINLAQAARDKISKNASKYPPSLVDIDSCPDSDVTSSSSVSTLEESITDNPRNTARAASRRSGAALAARARKK